MTYSTPNATGKYLPIVLLAGLLVAGCATPPDMNDREAVIEYNEVNDPLEPTNRAVFTFNQSFDKAILRPAAVAYRDYLPRYVQDVVHNILGNLRSPIVFINDVLQGEVDRAMVTFVRFMLNSTIGVGGAIDMATDMGVEGHSEDFGQTLAVWGVGDGPYIMLPMFGPSNPRDTIGIVVDFMIDPINLWAGNTDRDHVPLIRTVVHAVDRRADSLDLVDELEKSSLDFYAAIRSLYRQRRTVEIGNGKGSANIPAPGVSSLPLGPVRDDTQELSRR